MCFTTSATTAACPMAGEPIVVLPSFLQNNTRSKVNSLTRLRRQAFNLNGVARAHPVLLAPCFNYSIHI